MAWQDVVPTLMRYAINDVDDPQRYTDDRLETAWLVGLNYILNEFSFTNSYQLNLQTLSVNPDPVTYNDMWPVNLAVMKAAIMMVSNDLRLSALQGWKIRDIDMQVDFTEMYKGNKIILDEMQKMYDRARLTYSMAVNPSHAAILTPFNILAGGYRMPYYDMSPRDRPIW